MDFRRVAGYGLLFVFVVVMLFNIINDIRGVYAASASGQLQDSTIAVLDMPDTTYYVKLEEYDKQAGLDVYYTNFIEIHFSDGTWINITAFSTGPGEAYVRINLMNGSYTTVWSEADDFAHLGMIEVNTTSNYLGLLEDPTNTIHKYKLTSLGIGSNVSVVGIRYYIVVPYYPDNYYSYYYEYVEETPSTTTVTETVTTTITSTVTNTTTATVTETLTLTNTTTVTTTTTIYNTTTVTNTIASTIYNTTTETLTLYETTTLYEEITQPVTNTITARPVNYFNPAYILVGLLILFIIIAAVASKH